MSGLRERIRAGEIFVADGAMGTLLMERGLRPGDCPEEWNLRRPETLREIAGLYLDAGAEILHANTFGGSSLKLRRFRLDGSMAEINAAAVRAVREAAAGGAVAAASVGPTGCMLKPYGDADPEAVRESFAAQIRVLRDAGAELLTIETMTDLREARLAVEAARASAPELPVVATMTFDQTPRGFFTIMGSTIRAAAEELVAAGADSVGSNCGSGSDLMVAVAAEFRRYARAPIAIQPNAGLPVREGDRVVYRETPEIFAGRIGEMLDRGVTIVGGCCGTTPAHIAAIRAVVESKRRGAARG